MADDLSVRLLEGRPKALIRLGQDLEALVEQLYVEAGAGGLGAPQRQIVLRLAGRMWEAGYPDLVNMLPKVEGLTRPMDSARTRRKNALIATTIDGGYKMVMGLINNPLVGAFVSPEDAARLPEHPPRDYPDDASLRAEVSARYQQRYPTVPLIADPIAFVDDIRKRFESQRAHTPEMPYAFDYTDVMSPLLAEMIERAEQARNDYASSSRRRPHGLQLLNEVIDYLRNVAEQNVITYQDALHTSHYYLRALSVTMEPITGLGTWIDERVHRVRFDSPRRELAYFRERRYHVPNLQNMKRGDLFGEELKEIVVPTSAILAEDIFHRIQHLPIALVAVQTGSDLGIPGDGIVRRPFTFYIHDIGHAGLINGHEETYLNERGIDRDLWNAMTGLRERWICRLDHALERVEDQNLKAALRYVLLNVNHDQGYPLVPSTFLNKRYASQLLTCFANYSIRAAAGQLSTELARPRQTITEAYTWLRVFFEPLLEEELDSLRPQSALPRS